MAHLVATNTNPSTSHKLVCSDIWHGVRVRAAVSRNACYYKVRRRKCRGGGGSGFVLQCSSTSRSRSSSQLSCADEQNVRLQIENNNNNNSEGGRGGMQKQFEVCEYGWRVRRLIESKDEIRKAAQIQAEAFHVPLALFNGLFFHFFKAEVLSGLLYKLNNSPPNRYACLVAEAAANDEGHELEVVGIIDVTVQRERDVVQHLPDEAAEYVYISGIAVSQTFRRRRIATALLRACDMLSLLWGFQFLALRAYEEDVGARKLYANAGYRVVSKDPPWTSTWIGKKCRVLMIKTATSPNY